eukprot:TRINITY_DN3284_c0_g1_i1.p3 TRINITY_DN3284_c0_g1~~TRINITY_DN3284_c0_g1_i1.p3  ORF type:complete len:477 (-),score=73.07 TRINITY_DN3284_c0_g1_i1:6875-8305(-)
MNLLLPFTNKRLKEISLRKEATTGEVEETSFELSYGFLRLLEKELEIQRTLEEQKEVLESFPEVGVYGMFKKISGEKAQYIVPESMLKYMQKQEVYVNHGDIHAIFRRLDKDGDGRISYLEFLDTFLPPAREISTKSKRSRVQELLQEEQSEEPQHAESYETEKEDRPLQIPEEPDIMERFAETGVQAVAESENKEVQKEEVSENVLEQEAITKTPEKGPETVSFAETPAPPSKEPDEDLYRTPQRHERIERSPDYLASGTTVPSTVPRPALARFSEYQEVTRDIDPELTRILIAQIKVDEKLEDLKLKLWARRDFNAIDAFRLFDFTGFGAVTVFELKRTFEKLQVNYKDNDLYLLMKRYDQDLDGRLSLVEFERMFKPYEHVAERIPQARRGELVFSKETTEIFKEFLAKLIELEEEAEYIRKDVFGKNKTGVLSIMDAFYRLDSERKGYIFASDVIKFVHQRDIGKGVYGEAR